MLRLAPLLLLLACSAKPGPTTPIPAPSPTLPTWLAGAWQNDRGERETWVAASDVLWGIGFTAGGYEVMRLQLVDGQLVFTAWPGGDQGTAFTGQADATSFRVENPAHDFPKVITYRHEAGELRASVEGDGKRLDYAWKRIEAVPAPILAQADVDFAADTDARGADGWTAWFAPDGAMWRERRVEGSEAIHAAIAKTFASGFRLAWTPTASGLSPDEKLGFTVGTWTGTSAGKPAGTGTYLSIWARQPDGAWRVLFDLGSVDAS